MSQVRDHSEGRILGPGFLSSLPADTTLRPGNRQQVYITHNGREVEGEVLDHDTEQVSQHSVILSASPDTLLYLTANSTFKNFRIQSEWSLFSINVVVWIS